MALFLFTDAVLRGHPMKIFGHGKMQRDFTYVDDIVDGVVASLDHNHSYEIERFAQRFRVAEVSATTSSVSTI